ncbi:MAG: alpha/beta hydrolase [Acidimicrobiia bacterium]|nr:alpha/beta hydrolase [Acidimicrobiia bacterium]
MIESEGVSLAVATTEGTGPGSIVLAHATGFCKELWDPVLGLLSTTRTVVRFDTRAHGDSGDPGPPYDWWDLGRDVLAVAAGLPEPILGVGHSAGAASFVLAELLDPGRFEHLVLIEPIIFPGPAIRVDSHPLTEGALRRKPSFETPDAARTNFAGKAAFSEWAPEAMDAYVHGGLRRGPDGWELKCQPDAEADFYRGALAAGAWDRLGDIDVPVTLVAGEHSDTHTADFLARMAAEMDQVDVVIVPGTTHFVPMEAPGEVAELVEQVLE